MDWLVTYHALVDYFNKQTNFQISSHLKFCFEGSSIDIPVQLILVMKAQSLLKKGCQGHLTYVVSSDNDVRLDDITIV